MPINGCFFFFNDTATTEIYTLSLHDALPICAELHPRRDLDDLVGGVETHRLDRRRIERLELSAGAERSAFGESALVADRKSTRLNSSHSQISYAVFCLKKKKS